MKWLKRWHRKKLSGGELLEETPTDFELILYGAFTPISRDEAVIIAQVIEAQDD